MESLTAFVTAINGFVWGPPMLVLILGTGLFLQLRLKLMPVLRIPTGFRMVWKGRRPEAGAEGEITPYAALMTALAATVGTGNIAGVATAIAIGGPGALFWMWMTALVGMATKYAEVLLAVHYREVDDHGEHMGGPMFAIKNGLGPQWRWLAAAFALFGGFAGFGIGNMVQSNSIAAAINEAFLVPHWITGVVLAALTGFVLIGGIKRIGTVAEKLVPTMCIGYIVAGLIVLALYAGQIPAAFGLIFSDAFTGTAAAGGFAGSTMMLAMRYGVARGLFSNEAGLGSAPMVHATAQTDHPVRQGLYGIFEVFVDTILICTTTGLAILVTGAWESGATGAALSAQAFTTGLPGQWGGLIVTTGLVLFAFSTLIGWSYYGETGIVYLLGTKAALPYRMLWLVFIYLGSIGSLHLIWDIADTLNGLMAIPNLISVLISIPILRQLHREFFAQRRGATRAA
jgi:AGCS family alanine or glycine:cation symporter